jgi:hypothetical protein
VTPQPWAMSHRFDPVSAAIADRHYSRQKPGTPQFVAPGRCLVLRVPDAPVLWVTSWPYPEYTHHEWSGAWTCALFRNEAPDRFLSSDLITAAVAATRAHWGDPPAEGFVTFVDPSKLRPKRDPGRCFRRAGFHPVGLTIRRSFLALHLGADAMPDPVPALGAQDTLWP